jgi:hypothetical protein
MQRTVLVDVPFPRRAAIETICDNLLIGDVDTVAEKLVAEVPRNQARARVLLVQGRLHAAQGAMGSMELMIGEVKPKVEKALGAGG